MPTATNSPNTAKEQPDCPYAFTGRIKPLWKSPLYVVGLMLVATAMILLPVVYIGTIGVVGFGTYYHAVEHVTMLEDTTGVRARFLAYGAPLVIGPILIVFMIKPLFARRTRVERHVSLVPEKEPVLYAFVQELCDILGAPKPRRIDVDCQMNASAAFRRGFLSIFGRDMVLTIGVPLAAGMSLRQFAGVLAHEFGHFAQGFGMRLSYTIRTINAWFARVVYERDSWDAKLRDLSRDNVWYLLIVLNLSRLFVWLTRKILWCLMMLGHLISCGLLRQMEYDADRCAVRLVGSRAVERMILRLETLSLAYHLVHRDLAESWKSGQLADNLPILVLAKVEELPSEVRKKIEARATEARTGLLDTHPSDAARIRRARKENSEGVLRSTAPASEIFADFEGLCKGVTVPYYQGVLGNEFNPNRLISAVAMTRRRKRVAKAHQAADRYFQGCVMLARPLRIDPYSKTSELTPQAHLQRLKKARAALQKSLPVIRKAFNRYSKADDRQLKMQLAISLVKAGVQVKPKEFDVDSWSLTSVQRSLQEAQDAQRATEEELRTVESVFRLRLESALALLKVPQVAARVQRAPELTKKARKLLETLGAVHAAAVHLDELRSQQPSLRAMEMILAETDEEAEDAPVAQALELLRGQCDQLNEFRRLTANYPYPFEHADGEISIAQYALRSPASPHNLSGTLVAAEEVVDNMASLYYRTMGELAQIAERVEAACGLERIKAPCVDQDGAGEASPTAVDQTHGGSAP